MEYYSIKNWAKYQHYSDRNPPWIKLHQSLLRDYQYARLSDASKLLLISLFLIASITDNKIPTDIEWLREETKIRGEIDLTPLIGAGFLLAPDASTRREEKSREENMDFDEFFPKKEQEPLEIHKTSFDRVEEAIRPLCDKFYELWLADGCSEPGPDLRRSWIAGARKWYGDLGGDTALLERAVRAMRADNLVIKSPGSCIAKGYELKAIPPEKPFVEFD